MLILTRKPGQTIIVDGPAVIHIDDVKGKAVKVAVEAERTTNILRGEVERKERAA